MIEFKNDLAILPYQANAGFGLIFPAKTTLIKANHLFIISPGNLSKEYLNEIQSIDESPIVIAPNNFHHLYLKDLKNEIPKAQLFGTKRASKLSGLELCPNSDLSKFEQEIKTVTLKGNKVLAETCFYHDKSKTLIVTDLFFNMHHQMNFMTRFFITMAGAYHKTGTSRAIKYTIKDKKLFRESLDKLKDFPFERVIPNHGDPLSRDEFIKHIDHKIL